MKLRTSQAGNIGLEVVLAVVVLVLAVGAYWTYQQHMKSQSASSTTAAALSANAKTAAANAKQSQAALTDVKAFYMAWLADPMPTASSMEQQGYLTSTAVSAAAAAKTYDLFTCNQSALAFDKYKFSNPIADGNTATMLASAVYSGSTTTTIHLGLKMVGSKWQINSVSCPDMTTSK